MILLNTWTICPSLNFSPYHQSLTPTSQLKYQHHINNITLCTTLHNSTLGPLQPLVDNNNVTSFAVSVYNYMPTHSVSLVLPTQAHTMTWGMSTSLPHKGWHKQCESHPLRASTHEDRDMISAKADNEHFKSSMRSREAMWSLMRSRDQRHWSTSTIE